MCPLYLEDTSIAAMAHTRANVREYEYKTVQLVFPGDPLTFTHDGRVRAKIAVDNMKMTTIVSIVIVIGFFVCIFININ